MALIDDAITIFIIFMICTRCIDVITLLPCVWLAIRSEQFTFDCERCIWVDFCCSIYIVNYLLNINTGFYTVDSS